MPRAKRVDPANIVYEAPETLNRAEIAERLAAAKTAEEAEAILAERPTVGEYRVVEEALAPVEGPQGTTVLGPRLGERAVWVDEAPGDDEDGSGHFEVYDAGRHGEPYRPIFREEG